MDIRIGNQTVPLKEGADGKLQATFTADETTNSVDILSSCIGTLNLNNIQLEQGSSATPFVAPEVRQNPISGIFKDLRDVRLDIKDSERGLLNQININQDGLEQLVADTKQGLEARIISTADTYQREMADLNNELRSLVSTTARTWQVNLQDAKEGLESLIQVQANGIIQMVEDTEQGLITQIRTNRYGVEQLIANTEEKLESRITSTADTYQRELADLNSSLRSLVTNTARTWQVNLRNAKDDLESTIQVEAGNIIQLVEDTDSENFAKTEMLVNGLQSTVQGDLRSQRTQLENLISSSVEGATGSRSLIWQTLRSQGSLIEDNEGNINRIERRVNGLALDLRDAEGNYNSLTATVSGIQSDIRNIDGRFSTLSRTVDGLRYEISDVEGNVSTLTSLANGMEYDLYNYNGELRTNVRRLQGLIQDKVTRGDVESIIGQSGDAIWLQLRDRVQLTADDSKMSGSDIISEINLTRDGVRIRGDRLYLDGNTTFTNEFVATMGVFLEISADQITAGELDASQIRVVNLDVNRLTGNIGRFIQLGIQGLNRNIDIDSSGIHVYRTDGSRSNLLTESGIEFWRDGDNHGVLQTLRATDTSTSIFNGLYSVSLGAEYDAYVGLSYRPRGESEFTRAIGVHGQTGKIFMNNIYISPHHPDEGFRFKRGSVAGHPGIYIEHVNANRAGIFFANNGTVYIRNTEGTYSQVRPRFS